MNCHVIKTYINAVVVSSGGRTVKVMVFSSDFGAPPHIVYIAVFSDQGSPALSLSFTQVYIFPPLHAYFLYSLLWPRYVVLCLYMHACNLSAVCACTSESKLKVRASKPMCISVSAPETGNNCMLLA